MHAGPGTRHGRQLGGEPQRPPLGADVQLAMGQAFRAGPALEVTRRRCPTGGRTVRPRLLTRTSRPDTCARTWRAASWLPPMVEWSAGMKVTDRRLVNRVRRSRRL